MKSLYGSSEACCIHYPVRWYKNPVRTSTVRKTITASQLKMSCTTAHAKARSNSPRSPIWNCCDHHWHCRLYSNSRVTWVSDTMVLVTEVPMLAPITMGMACLKVAQKTFDTRHTVWRWVVLLTALRRGRQRPSPQWWKLWLTSSVRGLWRGPQASPGRRDCAAARTARRYRQCYDRPTGGRPWPTGPASRWRSRDTPRLPPSSGAPNLESNL